MKLKFIIHGDPVAKARHRSTRQGRMYNPQSAEDAACVWEIRRQLAEQAGKDFKPLSVPLVLSLSAIFARPKSHFGTGRNAGSLKKSAPLHHTKRPDLDNIIKRALDLMNAIIYTDDSMVVSIKDCNKRYGDLPRVEITLTKLEHKNE